jgi:hypothetical protein
LAAGVFSASAQVYSLNVVGYINVTVPANGYYMIANQLDAGAGNNTLDKLIPTASDGAQFYKFTGTYAVSTFDGLSLAWDNPSLTLNPGEGGFFHNNTAAAVTLTFVGEVMQGTLTNPLPAGYAIRSSIVPQQGTVTDLALPAGQDGDQIYVYNNGYQVSTYDSLIPGWDTPGSPAGPTIAVGQSFFIKSAAAHDWVRTFTVQ